MHELTLKRRVYLFLGVIFLFIPLALGGGYIALNSLKEYFSFPNVLNFSSFIIYGILCALILPPLIFISIPPIFLGRKSSDSVQKSVGKFIVYCFFISIIFQIGFSFYFVNELNNKGYIACKGIPSGWMPGMATKYALSENLCSKKPHSDASSSG
jgi:hypothetical protein